MRALWMQIAQTGSARVYALLLSLASTFITARYLGPEGRGVAAAAMAWVALFATFGGLSISQVVVFVAAGKEKEEWLPKTLAAVLSIIAVTTVAGWAVAAACALLPESSIFKHISVPILLLAFSFLPSMMWNESAASLLVSAGALHALNLWQVVAATASLAAVVLAVAAAGLNVTGAVLGTGVYQLVLAVSAFMVLVRRAGRLAPDGAVVRTLLSGGVRLHVIAISAFAVLQANVLFVNAFRSAAETGYYQLALQLIFAMQTFLVSISMVAQSVVTRDGPDRAWPRQKQLLLQSCAMTVAMAAGAFFLAPWIVRLVAGVKFMPAVPLFRILLIGMVGMNMGMVMGSQWLARGMFLRLAAISTLYGIVSAIANYVVIPRYGATGSAWVTTAVYSSAILVQGAMALWVNARWKASVRSAPAGEAARFAGTN